MTRSNLIDFDCGAEFPAQGGNRLEIPSLVEEVPRVDCRTGRIWA